MPKFYGIEVDVASNFTNADIMTFEVEFPGASFRCVPGLPLNGFRIETNGNEVAGAHVARFLRDYIAISPDDRKLS